MSISKDDVLKVAKLSRLALSADEVTTYTEQLDKILHHVEALNAVAPFTFMADCHLRPS